ncbi:MAG: hypothetical protein K9G62_04395 [Alphaproteobacteria bacterium]|nr:hypothetical protein [Alphaproteobacteria bacterium]
MTHTDIEPNKLVSESGRHFLSNYGNDGALYTNVQIPGRLPTVIVSHSLSGHKNVYQSIFTDAEVGATPNGTKGFAVFLRPESKQRELTFPKNESCKRSLGLCYRDL